MSHNSVETSVETFRELGQRLLESRELDEVQQVLDTALILYPEDGRLLELQGRVWHCQSRWGSARRAFELAATLVPLSLAAQLAMADSYRRSDQREDALTILSYLASRDDLPAAVLPNVASGLGCIGENQMALEICREAARREPDEDEPLYGMAFYMNRLDYPVECMLPLLQKTVSLEPESQLYRLSLAAMSGRAGDWDEAYESACHVAPGAVHCGNCLQLLATIHDRMGDHERRDACLGQLLRVAQAAQQTAGGGLKPCCVRRRGA